MATADDDVLEEYLDVQDSDSPAWERDHNKKRCPDCGGLHGLDASVCTVCGWQPT